MDLTTKASKRELAAAAKSFVLVLFLRS